jgi:hypothetical protein
MLVMGGGGCFSNACRSADIEQRIYDVDMYSTSADMHPEFNPIRPSIYNHGVKELSVLADTPRLALPAGTAPCQSRGQAPALAGSPLRAPRKAIRT